MSEEHVSEVEEILREGPPPEWYTAIIAEKGREEEERVIADIGYSDQLYDMEEGKVGEQMDQWIHYAKNPSEGKKPEGQRAIAAAEAFIHQATGFSPREIAAKRERLLAAYQGEKEAPLTIRRVVPRPKIQPAPE